MRRRRLSMFSVFTFWLCSSQISFAITADSTDVRLKKLIKKFDAFVKEALTAGKIPGAAVAIVSQNKIVHLKGYGVREAGRPERIDEDTVFRLASLSKGFAPVLTGLLVEDGVLDWDDGVLEYLEDFSLKDSAHTEEVTIRHILSHTSGVQEHAFTTLLDANVPYERIIKEIDRANIVCEVGECFSYQNVIYSLIADILKSATGHDYELLLRLKIFWPLAMNRASLGWNGIKSSANRATPHIRYSRKWKPIKIRKTYYSVAPAAGVNASISDMAKWLRALLGGASSIISPNVMQEVSTPLIRTSKMKRYFRSWRNLKKAWYGLGWRVFDYSGTKIVHHGGYVRGYRAEMAFAPEEGVGMVILMNGASRFA
ncbi:beta-lactamase family protein, partial [candidate division KSB1 bacterium]|nr:beta-lactamase family protein [candidate division KSB1 bacterium]